MSQPVTHDANRARTAEEVVEEIHSNLLECKVCFEKFSTSQWGRRPRNLPCGHAICLECVCALSHPVLRQLECPFCRRPCDVGSTYECRAILDLQEMIHDLGATGSVANANARSRVEKLGTRIDDLGSGFVRLRTTFGGWGCLINPTGMAVDLGASGEMAAVVVVHGGHERVTVFNPQGKFLHSFGRYGHGRSKLCHPLDVALTPGRHIVVTDAGDHSVKLFSFRGVPLGSVLGPFELPWGVAVDNQGHILVTDAEAGTLWRMKADFGSNVILEKNVVLSGLRCPRAVSCCRAMDHIVVVEHPKFPGGGSTTCLKVYDQSFSVLKQVDTFGLSLMKSVRLDVSCATFAECQVVVGDSERGLVWSLEFDLQGGDHPFLTPLVREGLVRPVRVVAMGQNSLVVLDAGDHTVKIYSARMDDSADDKI